MNTDILMTKLTEPETLPNGSIRNPNWAMIRAAAIIKQISEMGEQDKAGRLKAEQLASEQLEELINLRNSLIKLNEEAIKVKEQYNAVNSQFQKLMEEYAEYKKLHAEGVSGS